MSEENNGFIVFGSTGSVGVALTKRLAESDHVVAVGRNQEKLAEFEQLDRVTTIQIASLAPDEIDAAVTTAFERVESICGVVNCIGSLMLKAVHQTRLDEWNSVMETNLTSCFSILHAAVPKLRKSGGSIAFVSSAAAQIGMSNHEAIAAAKAGIEGLARSAAATYASKNIRVNCVAPGLVQSEMTKQFWQSDQARSMSEAMNPMSRLGEPEDIASCLAWLIDPANSWVTGQVIGVDGGMSSVMLKPRAKV